MTRHLAMMAFNTLADMIEKNPKLGFLLPIGFGGISAAGAEVVVNTFFVWAARVGIFFGAVGAILACVVHIRNLRKKE